MKLLHYTYRNLSLFFLLLVAVWGALFYYTLMDEVVDETDDMLENHAYLLIKQALEEPEFINSEGSPVTLYSFRPISESEGENYRERFFNDEVYIEVENEYEPVRVFKTAFRATNNRFYELTVMLSTLERDDMLETIITYLFALFILFLILTTVGTRLVLKRVFRQLDRLMTWVHTIQPEKPVETVGNPSKVREFRELEEAIRAMGNRSYQAYQEQKEFIENASHELQTPLAIAMGKVEMLTDNPRLTEKQMQGLDALYSTLTRAIRLNKSLLLLARIENGQYSEAKEENLTHIIDTLLTDLMEIYEEKQIHLVRKGDPQAPFILQANPTLMELMLSNLLKNALQHNHRGGTLLIETTSTSLTIANTGDSSLDTKRMFQRFYHPQGGKNDSNGLGLSIAYTIARLSSLHLTYRWEDGMHYFTIVKKSK